MKFFTKIRLIITLNILVVLSLPITYLYFRHLDGTSFNKIIEFKNTNIKTDKVVYSPGDTIRAYVSFCKYRNITPQISDALVDDVLTTYSTKDGTSGIVGCRENFQVDLEKIPLNEIPGIYHLNRVLTYQLPKRSLVYELITNDFQIVKPQIGEGATTP